MVLIVLFMVLVTAALLGLSFGYLEMRYRVLAAEDSATLMALRDGEDQQEWLNYVRSQAALGMVDPATLRELAQMGAYDLSKLGEEALARIAKNYHPSFARYLKTAAPMFVLALIGGVLSMYAGFSTIDSCSLLGVLVALAASAVVDMRFRVIPLPALILLLICGAILSRDSIQQFVLIGGFGMITAFMASNFYQMLTHQGTVMGAGDVYLLAGIAAALFPIFGVYGTFVFAIVLLIELVVILVFQMSKQGNGFMASMRVRIPLAPCLATSVALACIICLQIGGV